MLSALFYAKSKYRPNNNQQPHKPMPTIDLTDVTKNRHGGNIASTELLKVCNKCHSVKFANTSNFGINRRLSSGFKSICKPCEQRASRKPYGYLASKESLLEYDTKRFWELVNKTDNCWLWTGSTTDDGYGRFGSRLFRKRFRAHRFSLFLSNGTMPPNELVACHECDTPLCVNPSHLWLGTNGENIKDMWEKGRARPFRGKGSANGRAKLNNDQVIDIRLRYGTGNTSLPKLAKEFNVSTSIIHHIVKSKSWKHLPSISELKAINAIVATNEPRREGCTVLTLG